MEHTLSLIHKVAVKRGADFIVVAGDVFERLDVLHEERLLLSKWISQSHIPIVAISGNHDKRTEETGDTVLSYLCGLEFEESHVIRDGSPEMVSFSNCVFLLFPYNKWTDHEFYLLLDHAIPRVVAEARGRPVVVVMHEAVTGSVYDNGMATTRSNAIHLDEELLSRFSGVTYWALGDMHSCQSIASNVWYAGAPHQTKFGEKEGKGVLMVNTDVPEEPEFVELDTLPLVQMSEAPKDFVFDQDALYDFQPTNKIPASLHIPENVRVRAKIDSQYLEPPSPDALVDIFYGLDNALLRAGLKRDLVPLALDLAEDAAKRLKVRVEVVAPPKKREADAE
jgi:DNA repair exonuclease SbcCD nuclease subunit